MSNLWIFILLFQSGIIAYLLILFKDKQTELEQEKVQLDFANTARDYLLRSVNHELRAPMSRMVLDVEMVGDHEIKKSLQKDLSLMKEMIDELMEIEKVKFSHQELSEVDLHSLISEVVGEMGASDEVEIVSSVIVKIDGKPFQLKKLFKNLIENAFKYKSEDGGIRIDITKVHERVNVSILNEGSFIEADQLPFLFEPFFRRNEDTEKKGFGLGLYLCREVADSHGGSIKVASKKDHGTTFKVTF